jgi:hypothetical protein
VQRYEKFRRMGSFAEPAAALKAAARSAG